MKNSLKTEQWATWICLGAGGILCIGLLVEFALGLAPCPLCMMQRIWFALTGIVAWIGLSHNPRWGIYPLVSALCAMVGGGFAIRQLWLQSLPADQVPSCGPDLSYMIDAFPLGDLLVAMTSGTGDCAVVHDVIPLMSIAGWSLLGFSLLLFASVMQLRQSLR
ncbi:MAG: disulfide bond formation protein B [Gammaproteobacteria bacterium TMED243]|jgi:disulfide bond formation protein DsbB|nr:disulfide bond formation protein B [Gammaproteobacteria bacterium]RPG31255.1 MAG: disulfide bond formation protein B [Gammaproteobacteria bacterium TMED243]|tara:strand:- start:3843 stop:4331 length:489 start_codon:yes stop_codon:yes gene_type:complete